MKKSNEGLGFGGECGWKNPSSCPKKGTREAKAWLAGARAENGVDDLQMITNPTTFIKAVNTFIDVLYKRIAMRQNNANGSRDDTKKGHQSAVTVLKSGFAEFMTQAKQITMGVYPDGSELIKKMDFDKSLGSYKYKLPVYKLVIPQTNLPVANPVVTPTPTGGITAEQMAEMLANQNNNNVAQMATVDTSGSSVNTAYVAGGAVLVIGLLGAVLASKLKNKNKS